MGENDKWFERLKFYLEGEPPEKVIDVIKNIQYVYWKKMNEDFEEIIKLYKNNLAIKK